MKRLLLATALFLAIPGLASAQTYLMKVGDIKGSSQVEKHLGTDGWIVIEAFSLGGFRPVDNSNPSTRRGAVHHQPFQVYMLADIKAYPKLIEGFVFGTNFPKVEIHGVRTSIGTSREDTFLAIELENVILGEVSSEGSSGDSVFLSVTLHPEKVKLTTTEYNPDGGRKGDIETTYDVVTEEP